MWYGHEVFGTRFDLQKFGLRCYQCQILNTKADEQDCAGGSCAMQERNVYDLFHYRIHQTSQIFIIGYLVNSKAAKTNSTYLVSP